MKRYIFFILVLMLICLLSFKFLLNILTITRRVSTNTNLDYEWTLKEDIFSLIMAYPEYILDVEVVDTHKVYLILKSGNKLLYDDNAKKSSDHMLNNPSIKDMMSQLYSLEPINKLMPKDYNPGRIRVYPLLKEVYGGNQHEIEKNLKGIRINSAYHRFNSNNLAAFYLENAISELNELAKTYSRVWPYIYPIGGAYNFRYISKTNRLSPHAFGISIDLATNKSDYWQWASRSAGEKRIKSYPEEIVEIMERNYFIWGGKWGQFDIHHFEYRPEIIIKAKYFSNEKRTVWFEDLPTKDLYVSELISFIEEKLQQFNYN